MLLWTLHGKRFKRELLHPRPLSPHTHVLAQTWSLPVTSALVLVALVYLRGWVHARSVHPSTDSVWRLVAFLGGLLALWIAVGSSLRSRDEDMLAVHMVKHLLVMAVAAPLLLLGSPHLLLASEPPQGFVRNGLRLFVQWSPVERVAGVLTHPVFCWLAATLTVVVWHVPAVFALGMGSHWWHHVQFASFFAAGLLFWWPVIHWQTAGWSRWSIPVYLFLATLPCDALSAYLTFCDDVVYASYRSASEALNASALEDQQVAGALMWVFITFVYLVPAVVITIQMLSPGDRVLRSWLGNRTSESARQSPYGYPLTLRRSCPRVVVPARLQ